MPDYVPTKSGTLLIPSGTYHDPNKRHLFVICSDANAEDALFLVPISTWRNNLCDGTCILSAGCHEFISAKSFVLYRKSRVEVRTTIIQGVRNGLFVPKAQLGKTELAAVLEGIQKSPQTPRKLKHYFAKKC